MPDGIAEQAPVPIDDGGLFESGLAGERADAQGPRLGPEVGQLVELVDVDEPLRSYEPEVQPRHEALAARQHQRVGAVLGEEREGLVEVTRRVVGEARGLQLIAPAARATASRA
jgi:hypothetical protein